MKIYIGKANETLRSIAQNNNIEYDLLIKYNRAYLHKSSLEGCTIVLPVKEEEILVEKDERDAKPAVLMIDNEKRLEPLIFLATEYSYLLRELIITKFMVPTYTPMVYNSLLLKEDSIKKVLNKERVDNPLAISQAQEYKDFSSTILLLITAIKSHGIDDVKKQLGNLKSWPQKIVLLYKNTYQREETLKEILTNFGEMWRDYAIKFGAEKFEECEKIFSNILLKIKDFAKSILNKE